MITFATVIPWVVWRLVSHDKWLYLRYNQYRAQPRQAASPSQFSYIRTFACHKLRLPLSAYDLPHLNRYAATAVSASQKHKFPPLQNFACSVIALALAVFYKFHLSNNVFITLHILIYSIIDFTFQNIQKESERPTMGSPASNSRLNNISPL